MKKVNQKEIRDLHKELWLTQKVCLMPLGEIGYYQAINNDGAGQGVAVAEAMNELLEIVYETGRPVDMADAVRRYKNAKDVLDLFA